MNFDQTLNLSPSDQTSLLNSKANSAQDLNENGSELPAPSHYGMPQKEKIINQYQDFLISWQTNAWKRKQSIKLLENHTQSLLLKMGFTIKISLKFLGTHIRSFSKNGNDGEKLSVGLGSIIAFIGLCTLGIPLVGGIFLTLGLLLDLIIGFEYRKRQKQSRISQPEPEPSK